MRSTRLLKNLYRWVKIRSGEETIALLLFTFFFLITAPHTIIKALRYTDLLEKVGYQGLPLAYILAALSTGLVVVLNSKIQARISNQRLIVSSLIFFMLTGLAFQPFLDAGGNFLSYLYWVWASVLTVVLMTHYGVTLSEVFNPREARRLIGFCGSGGILGGVVGGFSAMLLTRLDLGHILLPLACALLFVCIFVVNAIFKHREKRVLSSVKTSASKRSTKPVGFRESFNIVRKHRYLILISAIVILTGIIATFVDYQFSSKIDEHFGEDEVQLQAFLGLFFGCLTTVAFFLQLLLTGRLLDRFGIRSTLLLAPMVLLLGSSGIIVWGLTLPLVILIKGSDESLAFSLNQSVREILYIPLEWDLRYKVRPFIDMFVNRFARVLAAVLLVIAGLVAKVLGYGTEDLPFLSPIKDPILAEYLVWAVLVFLIAWIILILKIHKEYISVIIDKIPIRRPVEMEIGKKLDIDYTKLVFDTIDSRDRSSVLFAMHLYDLLERDKLTPEIKDMIFQKKEEVNVSSLTDLFNAQGVSWFPDIADDISQEGLITDIREVMSLDSYQRLMIQDADRIVRAGPEAETEKMELAKRIGMMAKTSSLIEYLEPLIRDDSLDVARYAMESAARLQHTNSIPVILENLNRSQIHEDAVSALKSYGDVILGILETHLKDEKTHIAMQKSLAKVLGRIGTQEAADILVKELSHRSGDLGLEVLDALDRIRSESPDIRFAERIVKQKVFRAIKNYCRAGINHAELDPEVASDEDRKILQKEMDIHFREIFKLLGLLYRHEDMLGAYQNLKSGSPESSAFAIELLDNSLKKDVRDFVLLLVADRTTMDRVRRFRQILNTLPIL